MREQHFNGAVGQVAGRDILNFGAPDKPALAERSTEWLLDRRTHCRRKLREARRELLTDYALPLLLLGMLGNVLLIWLVVTSRLPAAAAWLMPAWVALTVGLPVWRLQVKRRREGALIDAYLRELDAIELVLYDRT